MSAMQAIVFIFHNQPSIVSNNNITFLQIGQLCGSMNDGNPQGF